MRGFSHILCPYEVGFSLPLLCCEQSGLQKINMEKQCHCGFDPTRLVLLYTCSAHTPCYKQDRQCTYSVMFRHVSVNIVALENNKNYTFQKCVFVALVIQQANHNPHCYVVCPAVRYFHIIS
jgi:hypothetical protein